MPDANPGHRRIVLTRAALAAAGVSVAAASVVFASGGLDLSVFGVAIRAHRPWLQLTLAGVFAALAVAIGGAAGVRAALESAWDARDRPAGGLAAAAALWTLVAGLAFGTGIAGSADAYGYVSQAALWRTGELVQPQPLAAVAPWPEPEWSLAPLGYRPASVPGAIVPTYPPGLPLTMAAVSLVAGMGGAFLVVPLLGAGAVWFAYRAARHLVDPCSAATAAWLLALSPVFLYQLVQPMSDVPVTAWWMGALWSVLAGHPFVAGILAAAAVLTRPNLVALAAWLFVMVLASWHAPGRPWGARAQAALRFSVPVVLAAAGLAVLNARLYGHPLTSGYGAAGALFSVSNVATNLRHYLTWLWTTQTPLVCAALAAPVLVGARRAWPALVFAALVLVSYLPYAPFEEWWYLRFLLPALPILLAMALAVAWRAVQWLTLAARVPAAVVGVSLIAGLYLGTAARGEAFALRALEQRYVDAGAWVAQATSDRAVLFAVQESGPLRLYGGRTTIRFDHIEPGGLDAAVTFLQQEGYQPYVAVEDWEEAQFRERFAGRSHYGRLDWPPVADIGGRVRVRIYDPRDRARYLAGEPVRTDRRRPNPKAATR